MPREPARAPRRDGVPKLRSKDETPNEREAEESSSERTAVDDARLSRALAAVESACERLGVALALVEDGKLVFASAGFARIVDRAPESVHAFAALAALDGLREGGPVRLADRCDLVLTRRGGGSLRVEASVARAARVDAAPSIVAIALREAAPGSEPASRSVLTRAR